MALSNNILNLFFSKNFQNLVKYLLSFNCETQVVALDSNANDLQTTGTKGAMLNGKPVVLAADAAYDISAEPAYAAWASGQSYTLNTEVYDSDGKHWVCVQAHTSAAANHPLADVAGAYWKRLDKWAKDGVGDVIAQDKQGHWLVCALSDGTIRAFTAYVPGTEAAATPIVIPAFDPERYVPVGLVSVVPTSGSFTLGTTAMTSISTIIQLTGPVFPDASNFDKN